MKPKSVFFAGPAAIVQTQANDAILAAWQAGWKSQPIRFSQHFNPQWVQVTIAFKERQPTDRLSKIGMSNNVEDWTYGQQGGMFSHQGEKAVLAVGGMMLYCGEREVKE